MANKREKALDMAARRILGALVNDGETCLLCEAGPTETHKDGAACLDLEQALDINNKPRGARR